MNHYIFSQNEERIILALEQYDRGLIKQGIIEHLKENPDDVLEHCRDFKGNDIRKYMGMEIVSFYGVNPRNNKVSLIINKGKKFDKEYYKRIES